MTTHGKDGVVVEGRDTEPVKVAVVRAGRLVDPTGVGDGYRAGYLAGLAWGLPAERCAQVGCALATLVIETVGTQEYVLGAAGFLARLATTYGDDAAADVEPHLRAPRP